MTELLSLYLKTMGTGTVFGFNGSISPGPLQNLLISETLSQGLRSSWRVAIIPLVTDPIALTVAVVTLAVVPNWVFAIIAFVGAAILSRIAIGQLRTKLVDFELKQTPRRKFWEIWMVNFTNPNLWIYAFTVNGVYIRNLGKDYGVTMAATYLISFFFALLSCNLTIAVVVAVLKKAFNMKGLVIINRCLGVFMLYMVVRFILVGFKSLGLIENLGIFG